MYRFCKEKQFVVPPPVSSDAGFYDRLHLFAAYVRGIPETMRKKKDYLPEIQTLKNWLIDSWEYICSHVPELAHLREIGILSYEKFPIENSRQMLLGFKEAVRDTRTDAKEVLSTAAFNELNLLLLEKHGIGLEKDDKRTIASLVRRGKINSEFEARFVKDYLSDAANREQDVGAYLKLDEMLLSYDGLL